MPSRFGCPHAVALGAWPLTDTVVSCRSTMTVASTITTPSASSSRRLISVPPETTARQHGSQLLVQAPPSASRSPPVHSSNKLKYTGAAPRGQGTSGGHSSSGQRPSDMERLINPLDGNPVLS
uniref:Uncharacterized protein n=1 Tax=uncultured Acidobacteria bacterium HF4000_26D02 TaxID=710731 RepID=E0XW87_9BACT|nr:hypothetical protein [uncultured Acidobacteria bacterium HF4000_26D02]